MFIITTIVKSNINRCTNSIDDIYMLDYEGNIYDEMGNKLNHYVTNSIIEVQDNYTFPSIILEIPNSKIIDSHSNDEIIYFYTNDGYLYQCPDDYSYYKKLTWESGNSIQVRFDNLPKIKSVNFI